MAAELLWKSSSTEVLSSYLTAKHYRVPVLNDNGGGETVVTWDLPTLCPRMTGAAVALQLLDRRVAYRLEHDLLGRSVGIIQKKIINVDFPIEKLLFFRWISNSAK